MTTVLLAASLALMGVIAGIYVTGLIHDHRIADLSASQYAAMHQMRDKSFRRVMPVLGLGTFNLVLVAVMAALPPGMPRLLGGFAVLMLLGDLLIAIKAQLPLNRYIQSWAENRIPADWSDTRDRWAFNHAVRSALGIGAYLCLAAAVFGSA
jgi:hypothetical protein